MNRTRLTQTFIAGMALTATATATYATMASHTLHVPYALALLGLAAATSRMKVKLPGIDGNMSVNLPFLLAAAVTLSAVEAIVIASISTIVQCWPSNGKKFKVQQMLFNVTMMMFAASLANLSWNAAWWSKVAWASQPLVLALTAAAFFFGQTAPVAAIIHLAEGASFRRTWLSIAQMSFPYFVLSAGVTSMMSMVSSRFGWQAAVVVFPIMYGVHHSYRMYFSKAMQAMTMTAPAMARAASSSM